MCLVILQPHGQSVPEDILDKATRLNDDGYGLGHWEGGVVVAEKTLNADKFKARVKELSGRLAVFHFRIGTSGNKTLDNAHPFGFYPEGDEEASPMWLFHNGILSGLGGLVQTWKCDTWHLARYMETIRDPQAQLTDDVHLRVFGQLVGPHNKLIVAGKDEFVAIVNEKSGVWRDGLWYSNANSFPYEKKPVTNYYGGCKGAAAKEVSHKSKHSAVDDAYSKHLNELQPWNIGIAIWNETVEPDSGVKSKSFIGWRMPDGVVVLSHFEADRRRRMRAAKENADAAGVVGDTSVSASFLQGYVYDEDKHVYRIRTPKDENEKLITSESERLAVAIAQANWEDDGAKTAEPEGGEVSNEEEPDAKAIAELEAEMDAETTRAAIVCIADWEAEVRKMGDTYAGTEDVEGKILGEIMDDAYMPSIIIVRAIRLLIQRYLGHVARCKFGEGVTAASDRKQQLSLPKPRLSSKERRVIRRKDNEVFRSHDAST